MPNRILRDWSDSNPVNRLSAEAERLFVRLIMKADDFGRFTANPTLIRCWLFPLLIDKVSETDCAKWLEELEAAGLIVSYKSSDKSILEIQNFGQRIRDTSKPKYPPPPPGSAPAATRGGSRRESALDEGEDVCGDGDEQGTCPRDGDEGVPKSAGPDLPGFERFWSTWPKGPRKRSKAKCKARWKRDKLEAIADRVVREVRKAKSSLDWEKGFVPMPLTWLNQQRWDTGEDDEPPKAKPTPTPQKPPEPDKPVMSFAEFKRKHGIAVNPLDAIGDSP